MNTKKIYRATVVIYVEADCADNVDEAITEMLEDGDKHFGNKITGYDIKVPQRAFKK